MKTHQLNLLIIAVLGLLAVIGCGSTGSNNASTSTANTSGAAIPPNEKAIIIKADRLTKEYEENEIASDEKYKSKNLEVSGRISNIAETLGKLSVQLEGHKENGINLVSVMCNFDESEKSAVSKLKKGGQVTFSGIGDGKTLGLYVGLNNCKIK